METLIKLSELVGKQRIAWRYDPVLLTNEYTVRRHLETFERMAEVLSPYIDRCIFSFVEMYQKLESNMPELIPLSEQDRDVLAQGLGSIAEKYGIYLQTCGTNCYANKNPQKAFENYKYHDKASHLLLGVVKHPRLYPLYHEIYDCKDRRYWIELDKELKVFAAEIGLDYVTNDDQLSRDFIAPPVIVNYFYHEQIRKKNRSDGSDDAGKGAVCPVEACPAATREER